MTISSNKIIPSVRADGPQIASFPCPSCGEKLLPVDVEMHLRCPFCGRKLDPETLPDEFMFAPAVDAWFDSLGVSGDHSRAGHAAR